MPPKVRFTREKIEETAYLMAKERGLDAVAAREVAKAMHMTVTPIFTYFSGMEELKRTVRARSGVPSLVRRVEVQVVPL